MYQLAINILAGIGLISLVAAFCLTALALLGSFNPIEEEPCDTPDWLADLDPNGRTLATVLPTDAGATAPRSGPASRPTRLVGNCACSSCRTWPGDCR